MTAWRWIAAGAVSGLLSVAIGAFGAHALDLSGKFADNYDTGVQYQMFHAVGMMLAGIAASRAGRPGLLRWAAALFALGTVLFSGSLYLYSITEISAFGAIAPLGGTSFIAGWALFAWGCRPPGGKA